MLILPRAQPSPAALLVRLPTAQDAIHVGEFVIRRSDWRSHTGDNMHRGYKGTKRDKLGRDTEHWLKMFRPDEMEQYRVELAALSSKEFRCEEFVVTLEDYVDGWVRTPPSAFTAPVAAPRHPLRVVHTQVKPA